MFQRGANRLCVSSASSASAAAGCAAGGVGVAGGVAGGFCVAGGACVFGDATAVAAGVKVCAAPAIGSVTTDATTVSGPHTRVRKSRIGFPQRMKNWPEG